MQWLVKLNFSRTKLLKFMPYSLYVWLLFNLTCVIAEELPLQDNCILSCKTSQESITRLYNIELMHHALKQGDYQGYDIILISSTTQEEADYQQKILEKTFAGTSKKDGRRPIILSVVDSTEGGQMIGSIFTWLRAEEKMRTEHSDLMVGYNSLLDYVRQNYSKVAIFHNGGKGERCSPLTQSLGNSRGSQKLAGSVKNALGEEIELEVLLGVILQCSSFAMTNQGTHVDTFWTSQIAFGSYPHDQLIRSNFGIDKFLVGFDKNKLIAQNIADFGTAALNKTGRMIAFYGNKRFASRKGGQYILDQAKIEAELLSKGDRIAYDFGSFAASFDMWQLLIDYWKKKDVLMILHSKDRRAKIKRDIDPHFIQPFIRLLYGIHDLAHRQAIDQELPNPATLTHQIALDLARLKFDQILKKKMPEVYAYIWEDVNHENDSKKKTEATLCMHEVIEFYLLYRQTPAFADLKKIFGFIDLGNDTQWFRYRRPIDIMNEKFEMLTDLIGKKIEVQLNGCLQEYEISEAFIQRCCEARLMRGIKENEIVKFTVEGKPITLTFSEVKAGQMIEGVYVKNSIIRDCDFIRGSSIVNSVLNHVTGKVIASEAYIESSAAPYIKAKIAVVHEMIDIKPIKVDREVVSDVYRTKVSPPYHGRMRAPIGYDPKGMPIYKIVGKKENGSLIYSEEVDEMIKYFIEKIPYDLKDIKEYSDETARTEDGRFTFEEIRKIEPLRIEDQQFRQLIYTIAKRLIIPSSTLSK
jgi:hypothetical protein